jgi:uncharacterized protein (DUF736 family)
MNKQQKNNTGALFPNESKNPKAPQKKGTIIIDGKEWAIAAWSQTSKAGKTYESLKVSEPWTKTQPEEEAF